MGARGRFSSKLKRKEVGGKEVYIKRAGNRRRSIVW